jgi:hypothetical protein
MLEKEIYGKTHFEPELKDVLECTDLGNDYTVDDWPWGRKRRCSMHFFIESNKRGQRFVKQSTLEGRTYKPKASTYDFRSTIVEIDGKVGHLSVGSYGGACIRIEDGKYLSKTFYDEDFLVIAQKFFNVRVAC